MTSASWPDQDLGTALAFTSNGIATSYDFLPGHRPCSIECIVDQAGTMESFVVNDSGIAVSLGAATAVTANVASGSFSAHFIDFPTRRLRMVYTNTNATAGTVSFRARAQ